MSLTSVANEALEQERVIREEREAASRAAEDSAARSAVLAVLVRPDGSRVSLEEAGLSRLDSLPGGFIGGWGDGERALLVRRGNPPAVVVGVRRGSGGPWVPAGSQVHSLVDVARALLSGAE